MQGAVQMPTASVKANTPSRTQASQTSSTSDDFVKLLQIKGQETKPSGQGKMEKEMKAENGAEAAKEAEGLVKQPEETADSLAEKPLDEEGEEDNAENAVQQAAAQQTAAWLARMSIENQEAKAENAVPETETLSAVGEILAETVQDVQAEVPMQNVQAEVPVQNVQTEVPVQNVQAEIPVQDVQAEVPVQNVQAEVPVQNVQAEVSMQNVQAEVSVQNVQAEVSVQNVQAEVSVQNVQAEVSVQNVQAEVPVQDVQTEAPVQMEVPVPNQGQQEEAFVQQVREEQPEGVKAQTEAVTVQTAVQEAPKQPEKAALLSDIPRQAVKEVGQENPVQAQEEKDGQDVLNLQALSRVQKPEESQETKVRSELGGTAAQDAHKSEVSQEGENSQAQAAAGADSFRLFGQQEQQHSIFTQRTESVPLKTTPDTLPQDLGKTIGANWEKGAGTLMVELEPASLGKLTIRLSYEGDRAAVSIMATNPKTLELLNQKASEIAAILEEKTGQETVIYTQQPESNQENYDRNPNSRGSQENREEKHQEREGQQQLDSFAQQLRLGLV